MLYGLNILNILSEKRPAAGALLELFQFAGRKCEWIKSNFALVANPAAVLHTAWFLYYYDNCEQAPGCGGGDEPNVNFNILAAGAVCLLSIRDFYAASV